MDSLRKITEDLNSGELKREHYAIVAILHASLVSLASIENGLNCGSLLDIDSNLEIARAYMKMKGGSYPAS